MTPSQKRDITTDIGIAAVGLAAATLTFTTLRDLAVACGMDTALLGWLQLSWLLPITIDVAGVIAARVWLKRLGPERAIRFARWMTWSCVAASVLGNGSQHYMATYHLTPPWLVVVLVSAVPPAMLGAVVHLGHLLGLTEPTPIPTEQKKPNPQPRQEQAKTQTRRRQKTKPRAADPMPDIDIAEARQLRAQGAGRGTFMKEYGLNGNQAKKLIEQLDAVNGHPVLNGQ